MQTATFGNLNLNGVRGTRYATTRPPSAARQVGTYQGAPIWNNYNRQTGGSVATPRIPLAPGPVGVNAQGQRTTMPGSPYQSSPTNPTPWINSSNNTSSSPGGSVWAGLPAYPGGVPATPNAPAVPGQTPLTMPWNQPGSDPRLRGGTGYSAIDASGNGVGTGYDTNAVGQNNPPPPVWNQNLPGAGQANADIPPNAAAGGSPDYSWFTQNGLTPPGGSGGLNTPPNNTNTAPISGFAPPNPAQQQWADWFRKQYGYPINF